METNVKAGNKTNVDPELDSLRQQWQGYINDSVNAVPFSK
jgi:hypothetical protein